MFGVPGTVGAVYYYYYFYYYKISPTLYKIPHEKKLVKMQEL